MNECFRDVMSFHRKFGCHIGERPAVPDAATVKLRIRLIDEEVRELMDALAAGDMVQIAKEGCDLIYVVVGTLIAYGIDPRPVWSRVQAANLSKDGSMRGDRKILKGETYIPPDVAGVLAIQPPLVADTSGEMTDGERAALLELEHRIATNHRADVIGVALREIRDRDLHRGTHRSFEDYVAELWEYSPAIAGVLIECGDPKSRYASMCRRIEKNKLTPSRKAIEAEGEVKL